MTAVFLVSAIAIWGTAQGFGPFARGTVPERVSLLYTFISVTATTALVMAARKRAEETIRRLSRQLARVQDEERRRIAGELHETVGQNLSASAMLLSLVNKSDTVRDPRARQRLAESITLTQQSIREIRTLSHLLHPPLLDELGLGSTLQWYTEGFAQRSGIRVALEVSPELERLQGNIELVLFRVVQECLLNIHRHSGSPSARIRLLCTPHELLLTVADEGRGMLPEIIEKARIPDSPCWVGIAGMHERVRQIGGRLEIQSDEQGTRVTAILPLGQSNS
jgi:signal transduction histidine kinase